MNLHNFSPMNDQTLIAIQFPSWKRIPARVKISSPKWNENIWSASATNKNKFSFLNSIPGKIPKFKSNEPTNKKTAKNIGRNWLPMKELRMFEKVIFLPYFPLCKWNLFLITFQFVNFCDNSVCLTYVGNEMHAFAFSLTFQRRRRINTIQHTFANFFKVLRNLKMNKSFYSRCFLI